VQKPTTAPAPTTWRSGGYLQKLPVDPWGHAYQYAAPGQHGEDDVFSNGPAKDKNDNSQIIGNWNLN
jgi:general secretion pathway protein G